MAESKGKIQDLSSVSVEVDGVDGKIEVAPGVVQSVTTTVPHEADASSAPGPYNDLDVNRPPVSTNRPDVPIAHSLIAGAGAPTGEPEYRPELGPDQEADYGAAKGAESAGGKSEPAEEKK
jgi:hypothetical protein